MTKIYFLIFLIGLIFAAVNSQQLTEDLDISDRAEEDDLEPFDEEIQDEIDNFRDSDDEVFLSRDARSAEEFSQLPGGIRRVSRKRRVQRRPSIFEAQNANRKVKKVLRRKVIKASANGQFGSPHLLPVPTHVPTAVIGGNETEEDQRDRDGRFFSLFTVVRFNNDPCPTSAGNNGTCYTSSDCSTRGGKAEGSCASGFGVCCFFQFQCGSTTSENGTYFTSPSTSQRICNLMINRLSDDICQIRLDLDVFELSQPDAMGVCVTDFFLVTGGSSVPQICGLNTGQHLIYSITPNSGPSTLSVVTDTSATTTGNRSWKIRITQLECTSRMLAPVGCLQYYVGASGVISSFNFRGETTNNQVNHLANQNYAICIRGDNGYCGIRYAQDVSDPFSFTLSEATLPATTPAILATGIKVGEAQCVKDYIIINSGSKDGSGRGKAFKDRYCGKTLGRCGLATPNAAACVNSAGAVTTFSRPFVVQVITDENETGDMANRGFKLTYSQQPCLGSTSG